MTHSEQTPTGILSNTKLIVAWVVLVGSVAGLLIVPNLRTVAIIDHENVQIESDIEQLSASDDVIVKLTSVRDELASFGEGRVRIIPARNDIAGLMTELSKTFDEAGLEGREMTSQREERVSDVIKMPMAVRVDGEFPQIYDVVRRLEHLQRLVRIGRLRIEKHGAKGRGGVTLEKGVSADILIEAFYEDPLAGNENRSTR